jgi:hypothetical protein
MRAGNIKAYAVSSETRSVLVPDVPTFGEDQGGVSRHKYARTKEVAVLVPATPRSAACLLWVKTRPPVQRLHVRSRQVQTFAPRLTRASRRLGGRFVRRPSCPFNSTRP